MLVKFFTHFWMSALKGALYLFVVRGRETSSIPVARSYLIPKNQLPSENVEVVISHLITFMNGLINTSS